MHTVPSNSSHCYQPFNTSLITLQNFPDTSLLKKEFQEKIQEIFNEIEEQKILILDLETSHFLEHIFSILTLKEKCNLSEVYLLDPEKKLNTQARVIYFVNPFRINILSVFKHASGSTYHCHPYLLSLSKITALTIKILGEISFDYKRCSLSFIPLRANLISLEKKDFYRECYINKNRIFLSNIAQALSNLQDIYGPISTIKGIGRNSQIVANAIQQLQFDKIYQSVPSKITEIILFDRDLDKVTPMLQQLNYNGLLDEIYGISGQCVQFSENILSKQAIKINLSEDKTFISIEGDKIYEVHARLSHLVEKLKEEELHLKTSNTLQELAANYKKAPLFAERKKECQQHIAMIGTIFDYVKKFNLEEISQIEAALLNKENSLSQKKIEVLKRIEGFFHSSEYENKVTHHTTLEKMQEYLYKVKPSLISFQHFLRFMILKSQINHGIPHEEYKELWNDVFQIFGYQFSCIKQELERMDLIREQDKSHQVQKQLELSNKKSSSSELNNIYQEYTPLSLRFVENLENDFANLLTSFPTKCFKKELIHSLIEKKQEELTSKPTKLIFFIGGMTWGEYLSLQLLQQQNPECNYLIGTTNMLNGNTIIQDFLDHCQLQGQLQVESKF